MLFSHEEQICSLEKGNGNTWQEYDLPHLVAGISTRTTSEEEAQTLRLSVQTPRCVSKFWAFTLFFQLGLPRPQKKRLVMKS